jgi:hypothetical protein
MKKDNKQNPKQSKLSLKKEALRKLTLTNDELKVIAGGLRPPDTRPTTPDDGC